MNAAARRVREQVCDRAGWACERCGVTLAFGARSVHHRIPRGMGGTTRPDVPSNLVLLCGTGTTGCHGAVESDRAEAYEAGWLVPQSDDPAHVPVAIFNLGPTLLDDTGRYQTWRRGTARTDDGDGEAPDQLCDVQPEQGTRRHHLPERVRESGLCVGHPHPGIWQHVDPPHPVAVELCRTCPAADPCLLHALDTHPQSGIWAGTTPQERTRMLNRRAARR